MRRIFLLNLLFVFSFLPLLVLETYAQIKPEDCAKGTKEARECTYALLAEFSSAKTGAQDLVSILKRRFSEADLTMPLDPRDPKSNSLKSLYEAAAEEYNISLPLLKRPNPDFGNILIQLKAANQKYSLFREKANLKINGSTGGNFSWNELLDALYKIVTGDIRGGIKDIVKSLLKDIVIKKMKWEKWDCIPKLGEKKTKSCGS